MQEEELSFLDPSRHQSGQYTIVVRGDHKLVPKSVKKCQQCRMDFNDMNDKCVIKTVGAREVTDDSGKRKTYTGNIYLHFLKKCLESYDFNFDFNQVIVPEKTKDQTPESWKKALRKHGLNI